jgi:NADH-quinone oxidoreductase subunit G
MLEDPCKAYFLMGLEPEFDMADPGLAQTALSKAEFVVSLSVYANEQMGDTADMILPIASVAETSGTFVNAEGRWQGFSATIAPQGESKPAWKILRMLGNLAKLDGFDYVTEIEVLDEIKLLFADQDAFTSLSRIEAELTKPDAVNGSLMRISDTAIYGVDAVVRRASALQQTHDAIDAAYLNAADAKAQGVSAAEMIKLSQDGRSAEVVMVIDDSVPKGCVVVPLGTPGSAKLGSAFGSIEVSGGGS